MSVVKYPSCPCFLSCKINLKNRKINMSSDSGPPVREATGHCSGRVWALESDKLGLESFLCMASSNSLFLGHLSTKWTHRCLPPRHHAVKIKQNNEQVGPSIVLGTWWVSLNISSFLVPLFKEKVPCT